jgi:hypothetical protein
MRGRTSTQGLFVAPTTTTPLESVIPSISFRSVVNIPVCDPCDVSEEEDREAASASISSYCPYRAVSSRESGMIEETHEEDNTWLRSTSLGKEFSNASFALSDIFAKQLNVTRHASAFYHLTKNTFKVPQDLEHPES